jgi:hypothetical protein
MVEFVYRSVSRSANRILTSGKMVIVEADGSIFYYASNTVEVGGPFVSVAALLRSEGRRRYSEGVSTDSAGYEVFEWAGSFFGIEGHGAGKVRQYADLQRAKSGAASEREADVPAQEPPSAMPAIVAHADWGSDPKKRWMCVATRSNSGSYHVASPEPVGDASTLLRRLRDRAGGANVVVGFDFPIGVPAAYAAKAGIDRFPEFLAMLGRDGWRTFYEVAEKRDEIGIRRPFYPKGSPKKGEVTQRDLLEGLGVESMSDLLRACDRSTATRGAACPIFWTLGGNQVGKAAIIGWKEVLTPALNDGDLDVGLWPFDGQLEGLIQRRDVVIVETYPAEACTHLGLSPPGRAWGKRSQEGRRTQAPKLLSWAAHRSVTLEAALIETLEDGFGPSKDAEDPFDSLIGLLSMLEVLMGYRPTGLPINGQAAAVEGWIFGQVV